MNHGVTVRLASLGTIRFKKGQGLFGFKSMVLVKASLKDIDQIVSFRHRILHHGGPVERVIYKEDKNPATTHLILKTEKGELDACGTLIKESESVFRIRGMAVSEELRGQGVGSLILDEFLSEALGVGLVWCNARVIALSLYERKGFKRVGSVFDVPGSGPHFRMELI